MKPSFLRFSTQDFEKLENLQQLRERLLNALLLSAFFLGTVLLAVALIPVLQRHLYEFQILYALVYLWLILVTFNRRLSYTARTVSWLVFFYLLGLVNLVLSGFNADAGLFFLTFVAMSALLFDLRKGLLAFGISSITILIFAFFIVSGQFNLRLEVPQPANPLLWIIGGGVFLVTSMSLIIAMAFLVQGLVVNLAKVTTDARKLEETNRTLRMSEERYRSLVEISPDLIILMGLDGRIILTNPPGLRLFGYEPTDVLGDNFLDFIHPDERAHAANVFQQILRVGLVKEVVIRVLRKGGDTFFMEFSASIILDGNGNPHAVMGVGRDITIRRKAELALQEAQVELEQKVQERTAELVKASERLRQNEETGRAILNASEDILLLLDSNRVILAANNVIAERLGKTLDEILGKPVDQFFPDEISKARNTQFDKVLQTGKSLRFEDSRDGFWFENHYYPILDESGQVTQVVVSSRDVTERKRMEESLAEARDKLEQRVAERTWELLDTQEELRDLTKRVILAQEEERRRVSRELHDEAGQALISMKYGLETILADLPEDSHPIRRRLVSALEQLDETMERIRHLAHSLRPPLFDIADLDLTLKDYCHEFAESTGLKIEYTGISVPSLTEEAGLSFFRFLQESLTNVVKHANATHVDVKLSLQAGRLSLSVADNGAGASDVRVDGHGHIGMRERFMMLKGDVQIQSNDRLGFIITASIPYGAHNFGQETTV